MVEYADVFGKNLRRIREERKITRKEFETKTGIPTVTIAGYENGLRTPNFKNLVTIADTLEVTTDELLGRDKFLDLEIEKKKLESRFERAKKLMILLGLVVYVCMEDKDKASMFDAISYEVDTVNFAEIVSVLITFDSYSSDDSSFIRYEFEDENTQLFEGITAFVEYVESAERQAVRQKKTFEEVFFASTKLNKHYQEMKENRQ